MCWAFHLNLLTATYFLFTQKLGEAVGKYTDLVIRFISQAPVYDIHGCGFIGMHMFTPRI